MNNDLISRSALLEEINNFSMRITGSANDMALVIMDETKKSIMRMVEEQPAVYDVDKVVKELNEYAHSEICKSHNGCPYIINENMNCENCGAMGALKIVKSGGIE